MSARALLLAALLLAPLAAAASGEPEPFPWSPYNTGAPVQAVSLSAEGTTVAAGLGPPPAPNAGTIQPGVPRVVTTDLAILDLGAGFAMSGTDSDNKPEGRAFAAVSRDGSTVVSVGNDTLPNAQAPRPTIPDDPTNPSPPATPTASEKQMRLFYQRAPAGANFSAGRAANLTAWLEGRPVGLAVSDDGLRVAVALQTASGFSVRGYRLTGNDLAMTFEHRSAGEARGLAASGDLVRVFAAVMVPDANTTRAGLLLYTGGSTPSGSWYDPGPANTTARAVAASRDGARVALGTGDGRLLLFDGHAPAQPLAALTVGGAADAVGPLAVSEDGRRVSAASGRNLTHLDGAGAVLWRANLSAPSAGLALNRTGELLLAAVPPEGLLAFGDQGPQVLWRNAGDARAVSVTARGDAFAFGRGSLVLAMRIPRNLSLEHASGGDEAPLKPVKAGESVTWDLNVRNHGAAPEVVRLSGPDGLGLGLSFDPPEAYVRPGETRRVAVTAHAAPDFTGGRIFNLTAVSLSSEARDETTLTVALQTAANVTLLLDTRELTARANETTTLLLGIQNRGNRDAAVGIQARQNVTAGAPWDVRVDPPSLTLAPSSLTTVRVQVTPPADVPNGTAMTLTLRLEGEGVSDQATVTMRINPVTGIEVRARPHIQFVQPGKAAHYNITVKNTGSLPRQFEAWYDLLPVEGVAPRAWAVDMATSEFRLDAGATRTIPVRILAPADVTPSDRVAVRISARMIPLNDTEAPLLGNVTLFANGEAPVPTPGTEGGGSAIPGAGLPLAALAAVAAALALRRRRA